MVILLKVIKNNIFLFICFGVSPLIIGVTKMFTYEVNIGSSLVVITLNSNRVGVVVISVIASIQCIFLALSRADISLGDDLLTNSSLVTHVWFPPAVAALSPNLLLSSSLVEDYIVLVQRPLISANIKRLDVLIFLIG